MKILVNHEKFRIMPEIASINIDLLLAQRISTNGTTTNAVSAANQGKIVFDQPTQKYMVSENKGAYVNLVPTDGVTIATLPSPPVLGMIASVTDGDSALAWGATAVNSGMGATHYKVWYNGSNWTVMGK